MRTTLEIDDDVMFAAKELAAKQRKTAGKILSEFFRDGMRMEQHPPSVGNGLPYALKNGIPVLPARCELVTTQQIQRIMEEEGI
jgi:hypothetical protein